MQATGGGSIVNIASSNAYGGMWESGVAYAAAKGAVISFTKRLALETAEHGIRVNATVPATTGTARVSRNFLGALTGKARAHYLAYISRGRIAEPVEQAITILFLASDLASFVTGATLDDTGGAIVGPTRQLEA